MMFNENPNWRQKYNLSATLQSNPNRAAKEASGKPVKTETTKSTPQLWQMRAQKAMPISKTELTEEQKAKAIKETQQRCAKAQKQKQPPKPSEGFTTNPNET